MHEIEIEPNPTGKVKAIEVKKQEILLSPEVITGLQNGLHFAVFGKPSKYLFPSYYFRQLMNIGKYGKTRVVGNKFSVM